MERRPSPAMHALKRHLENATNVCADIKADLGAFSGRFQPSDVNAGAASSASLRHGTGPVLAMEESLPTPQQSSVNDAVLAVEAVIRRFIEEAGCEHIMVSAIAELVHASRGSKANARDGGATDTMTILSGLSQEALEQPQDSLRWIIQTWPPFSIISGHFR